MLAMIRLLPLAGKLGLAAALFVGVPAALYGAHYAYSTHYINEGRAQYKGEVDALDKAARDRANAGGSRVDDCYNTGGVWDAERRECGRR